MDAVVQRDVRKWGKAAEAKWLCRFFTWWWFSLDNRRTRWPTKVVQVLGISTFRVNKDGGQRMTVWLWGEGCQGYELHRQAFKHLGHFLMRFKWFRRWNRDKCPKCGHDTFHVSYRDYIDHIMMESETVCSKCLASVYYLVHGYSDDFATCAWERLELRLFGDPAAQP